MKKDFGSIDKALNTNSIDVEVTATPEVKPELPTRDVSKELDKLKRLFNGIIDMSELPDAVIFTNLLKDSLAIQECLRLGIPTICIVDTNCNPDLIPYPIPANDDSSSSINFILNYLVNRILAGQSDLEAS